MKSKDVVGWLNYLLSNGLAEGEAIDEDGDWWIQEWEATSEGLTLIVSKYEEGVDDPVEKKMFQLEVREGR